MYESVLIVMSESVSIAFLICFMKNVQFLTKAKGHRNIQLLMHLQHTIVHLITVEGSGGICQLPTFILFMYIKPLLIELMVILIAKRLCFKYLLFIWIAEIHVQDIPIFTIGVDAEDRSFHRLIMQRFKRISSICSTKIHGAPVTPPILFSSSDIPEEMYTFHIVQLVENKKGKILCLFRETDMYFIAFNPSGDPYSEWFMFRDTPIPTFFKQICLPYDCRYKNM